MGMVITVPTCEHPLNTPVPRCPGCKSKRAATRAAKAKEKSGPYDWSVGLTTCPRQEPQLNRTLRSLAAAGFSSPVVFADEAPAEEITEEVRDVVVRPQRLGAWGNWLLSLSELLLRDPHAGRYLIVQDDVLFARNLRQFLDRTWKGDYLNLYTADRNKGGIGYHTASRRGLGALALAFSRKAALQITANQESYTRITKGELGTKNIDGAVWKRMNKHKHPEIVHSPSLTNHIGHTSTLHQKGIRTAGSFIGEGFDLSGKHRSAESIDTVNCKSCGPSVRVKVFECAVYGRCTVGKKVPGLACCKGCGGCG